MTTARSKSSRPSARSNPPNTATSSNFVPTELASTAREQVPNYSKTTSTFTKPFPFQLSKKLNFPLDQHIYKGLVPVNVNDSVIHRDCPPLNKRAMHNKYLQKMKNKKRDPEPDLNDFLTDIQPLHEAYPKYKIDTSVDISFLPKLPRGNADKVTEIIFKLGTLD